MRKIYLAFSVCSLLYITSCSNATNANAQQTEQQGISKTLAVDEYAKKLSESPAAQLVDVRTPEEFAEGHLKNAINIDFKSDNFTGGISKLDKSKPVFIYCASGRRSTSAAEQMHNIGFTQVYNMKGGITEWNSKGKPTMGGK